MKTIESIFCLVLVCAFALCVQAAELSADEMAAIGAACTSTKAAYLTKDHATLVDSLYPELVRAAGGREKMIEMLKQEDEKNKAAGVSFVSLEHSPRKEVYTGNRFKVVFVDSLMVGQSNEIKFKHTSFMVAFQELGSPKWYLLDGTRLTKQQFRSVFQGLPVTLDLPPVKRERIE
jgi:hypothetical protein